MATTSTPSARKQYATLRAWRHAANLTQEQAGKLLGTTTSQYNRWENGFSSPARTRLHEVARITGVPLLTLLRVA